MSARAGKRVAVAVGTKSGDAVSACAIAAWSLTLIAPGPALAQNADTIPLETTKPRPPLGARHANLLD